MKTIMALGVLMDEATKRGDDRAIATLRDAAEILISDHLPERALPTTTRRGRQGYVYYAVSGSEVKIGYSRNPWSRVNEMRTARPDIRLAGVEPGNSDLERSRHEQFAAARLSREWFRITPEIRDLIASVEVRSSDVATNFYAPPVFPHTPFPAPSNNTTHTTREREGDVYSESVENLTSMLSERLGPALWPDVDAFIRARRYETWGAWIKQMLTEITGGQATEVDLAQACRDASALDRPLGSPLALRAFIAKAVRERKEKVNGPPTTAGAKPERQSIGARAFATARDAIKDL